MTNKSDSTQKHAGQNKPWYHFPQMWLVVALPAITVIAGLATVYIAHKNPPIVLKKEHRFHLNQQQGD